MIPNRYFYDVHWALNYQFLFDFILLARHTSTATMVFETVQLMKCSYHHRSRLVRGILTRSTPVYKTAMAEWK